MNWHLLKFFGLVALAGWIVVSMAWEIIAQIFRLQHPPVAISLGSLIGSVIGMGMIIRLAIKGSI